MVSAHTRGGPSWGPDGRLPRQWGPGGHCLVFSVLPVPPLSLSGPGVADLLNFLLNSLGDILNHSVAGEGKRGRCKGGYGGGGGGEGGGGGGGEGVFEFEMRKTRSAHKPLRKQRCHR